MMMLRLLLLGALAVSSARPQPKELAKARYEAEDYPAAIAAMQQAVSENGADAEAWFLLGWYTHYRCYDSRPNVHYGRPISDSILRYFDRALELDSTLGNARYFIGAERGARFENCLLSGDIEQARAELRAGRASGAFPDWLLEYGRNVLRSCGRDAILFTWGDAEVNAIRYVQFIDRYRTDVSSIPALHLNRPAWALLVADGIPGALPAVTTGWSREQVLQMHPFKWRQTAVEVPVPAGALDGLEATAPETVMTWVVPPDLSSGERSMLSPAQALLCAIVEANRWARPICFTLSCPEQFTAGLDENLQPGGLVRRLLPVPAAGGLAFDRAVTDSVLMSPRSYRALAGVRQSNMPRASWTVSHYITGILMTAHAALSAEDKACARRLLDRLPRLVPERVYPMPASLREPYEQLRALAR